jgi:general secretion pathway protein J
MMHRGIPGRTTANGFTLVEVLLALTLLSMLLGLAYGGLRAATRAADKGQTVLEDSGRIRMAHQFVRKQLNQMLPLVFAVNDDESERTVFVGEPQRIRFVAPMPGYLGFGGPQVQEISLVRGKKGLDLVLTHALLQGFEEADLDARPPILLMDNIDDGNFSFLGRDENGELMDWTGQWQDGNLLPEAVALDIEFNEEVYIRWPELTASVRTDPRALLNLARDDTNAPAYSTAIRDLINRRAKPQ